ncbi:MAG: type IV pilus assembly protein PilM [Acidobacteriota bacterium]|nr:type IV pilus assembly protein PilM [Acidobacteriota bacterium]MDH3531038.1 type IV pilus assembly protein PilM [Acidobacteriota bacterium]
MLFGKKKSVAGLDVGSSSVKVVELDGKVNNLNLVSLGFENLPDDTVVDGQIMELNAVSEVIQNVCTDHKINANQVVTGVSGHSVIIKNIVLPPMSRDELEESIDWHAEEHIPYDLSDVSLDYHITAEDEEATSVMIAACKRERLDNIKQAIQLSGKNPVVIDVDTFALQNCYEVNYQPDPSQVVTLLNIGASTMNVNIVQGTQSLFTRDITVGGSQFTDILQKSLGYSFEQAEAVKRGVAEAMENVEEKSIEPLMNNVTEMVAMEIQKTFDFYRATAEDDELVVDKILISGGGSKLVGLSEDLASKLEVPVEVLDPFRQIKVDTRKFDPDYLSEIMPEMAVAVGLAIRGVEVK